MTQFKTDSSFTIGAKTIFQCKIYICKWRRRAGCPKLGHATLKSSNEQKIISDLKSTQQSFKSNLFISFIISCIIICILAIEIIFHIVADLHKRD